MRASIRAAAICLSALAAVSLGFSQAAPTPAAATAAAAAVAALPQPPGSTKITFWFGLTGVNGDVVREVVNKYNASQSKYYVEAVSQPDYDATINKLNTSLAGGDLPNAVQVYDIGTQRMIDTKKIVPVQDLIDKEKLDIVKDLEPAVASYYTIAGKLYSMPFNSSAPVMYFDKTAFKEVGLDVSKRIWTYDEVAAAAKKLIKKDADGKVTRHGIGFTLYSWILEQELAAQGALFADPGNGRQSRAKNLVFDSKAGENWLNFLKSLIDTGSGESFGIDGGANSTARDAAFVTGEACMTLNSIAGLRGYIKSAKDAGKGVDVGVAYIPRPAGAPGGVIIGGASLWMTDTGTSEQQAGAWDFLKFASTPEIQAFFSANTGYYPTRKAAYAVQDMKDALALYPQFQIAIDELRATRAGSPTQGAVFGTFVKARSNVQGAMEQFVTGKIPTALQALSGAAKMSTSELEEYNSMTN
jgi:sn-glycerol 3-phosphate transport system substrate-binding protein